MTVSKFLHFYNPGLFWFCISPLFTDPQEGSPLPRYLDKPEAVFDPIWALPDHGMHALGDSENSSAVAVIR
jgi:hypothetical protein